MKRIACLVLLAFISFHPAAARSKQPVLCKYKTFTEAPLRAEPHPDAPRVGTLPKGKTLQALDKKSYWVKLRVKDVEGWAAEGNLIRSEDCPRVPFLEFRSNGYKIVSGVFRNFFGIYNSGSGDYSQKITLRLFKGSTTLVEKMYDLAGDHIVAGGGRSFFIDTEVKADTYEFETTDGKVSGEIGKLIEVIP